MVGFLSLAIDLVVYVGLHMLGLPAAAAAAGGYVVGFAVNFGLNRNWVFAAAGASGRHLRRYSVLVLANLALTTVSVGWLVDGAHVEYRLAKLAVAAVIAVVNFVLMRVWVFRT